MIRWKRIDGDTQHPAVFTLNSLPVAPCELARLDLVESIGGGALNIEGASRRGASAAARIVELRAAHSVDAGMRAVFKHEGEWILCERESAA